MVDLLVRFLRVLLMRIQIEARTAIIVISQNDLLACLVLFRYVICSDVGVDAVFAAPEEGRFEAGGRVGQIPFGGPEVAEEAFAG